jgi:hypothetical protein
MHNGDNNNSTTTWRLRRNLKEADEKSYQEAVGGRIATES